MTNVLTNTIDILIDKENIVEVEKGLQYFKGVYDIKEKDEYYEVSFCATSLEELAKAEIFLVAFV